MSKETAFTVFCMENYKAHRKLTGKEVLQVFSVYGVFDYIREFYDVLHTTGLIISSDAEAVKRSSLFRRRMQAAPFSLTNNMHPMCLVSARHMGAISL